MERQAKDGTFYGQVGPDAWEPVQRRSKDGQLYNKVGPDSWSPVLAQESLEEQAPSRVQAAAERAWEDALRPANLYYEQMKNLGKAAIGAANFVEEKIDEPTRRGIYQATGGDPEVETVSGKQLMSHFGISDDKLAKGSFSNRDALKILEMSNFSGATAPAGLIRMLSQKKGGWLDQRYSPADWSGFGAELILSPLNILGTGALTKAGKGMAAVAKRGARGLEGAAKGARKAVDSVADVFRRRDAVTDMAENVKIGGEFQDDSFKSLQQINEWEPPEGFKPLTQDRLAEIMRQETFQHPPNRLHFDMLRNHETEQQVKVALQDAPEVTRQKLALFNEAIIQETATNIQKAITGMTKGRGKILNKPQAGEYFADTVWKAYRARKEQLKPAFNRIKMEIGDQVIADPQEMIARAIFSDRLNNELFKVSNIIDTDVNGALIEKPFDLANGFDREVHDLIQEVFKSSMKGLKWDDTVRLREALFNARDPQNYKRTKALEAVRDELFEIQQAAAIRSGAMDREALKKLYVDYAKNESMLNGFESIAKGKINDGRANYDPTKLVDTNKIIDKFFDNPNYVEWIQEHSRQLKTTQLDDGLMVEKVKGTEENPFSSFFIKELYQAKLDGDLVVKAFDSKKNYNPNLISNYVQQPERRAIMDMIAPGLGQKIHNNADYGYYGKIFAKSVNPSGSGLVLKDALGKAGFSEAVKNSVVETAVGARKGVMQQVADATVNKGKQKRASKFIRETLGEIQPTSEALSIRENAIVIPASRAGVKTGEAAGEKRQEALEETMRPLEKGEYRQNADGSKSSEISITVTDTRINNGAATNIPTLYKQGDQIIELSEEEAIEAAAASGKNYKGYGTIKEAVKAAKERSKKGGAYKGGN